MHLDQLFKAYTTVLRDNAVYWQFSPFMAADNPWAHLPRSEKLLSRLNSLSAEQLDSIDQHADKQRKFFAEYFTDVFTLPCSFDSPFLSHNAEQSSFPFWLSNGIGGRKLAQINAFIAALPELHGDVLEWCAGKGHLGRLLGYSRNVGLRSVEYNADLCRQGERLASQHEIKQQFVCADVLLAEDSVFSGQDHAVALHACGDLHNHLLKQASSQTLLSLHVAPCCYHLINSTVYQPLSQAGQRNNLNLSRDQLKLAVQAQVTGGERVRRLRHREVLWRQMYQLVLEHYLEVPDYQPLSSVPKHWFSGSVDDFINWAATQHEITLPPVIDWIMIEHAAKKRVETIQRMELVRHVFRRPLEIWLILDRALYLEEQGYKVTIQEFCDYSVSPRNFLIQAFKQ